MSHGSICGQYPAAQAWSACYDDTTGTGTAGTANTWFRNNGETENRPGLCKKGQ